MAEFLVLGVSLGVLLACVVSSLAAIAGEHAERDLRVRAAVLRSKRAVL